MLKCSLAWLGEPKSEQFQKFFSKLLFLKTENLYTCDCVKELSKIKDDC